MLLLWPQSGCIFATYLLCLFCFITVSSHHQWNCRLCPPPICSLLKQTCCYRQHSILPPLACHLNLLKIPPVVCYLFMYLGLWLLLTHSLGYITTGNFKGQMKPVHTSWSRFWGVNCCASVSNYQLSHIWSGVWTTDLRDGRWVCYPYTTKPPLFVWVRHFFLTIRPLLCFKHRIFRFFIIE